jgi:protein involved in polysaccharide export with SLBB domain
MPNDVVSVSKANIVYVVGDGRGWYVTNGKLSVLQALSLAGDTR